MERDEVMKGFDEMAANAVVWEEIREAEKPAPVEHTIFSNPFFIGDIIQQNEREHADKV